MKTPYYLVLALAVLDVPGAQAMSFKTNLRPVQLPTTTKRSAQIQSTTPIPGSMSITGQMYCGDADVEHFVSEQGGLFDIVNGDTEVITYSDDGMSYDIDISTTKQPVYTTIGYWLVRDGEEPLPTKDNFNSVAWGYLAVTPDGMSAMKRVFPTSFASDARGDMLQMLRKEVSKAQSISNKPLGYEANYRVYMGVFGCINPVDEAGAASTPNVPGSVTASSYRPSNVDLAYSFSSQAPSEMLAQSLNDSAWATQSQAVTLVNSLTKVRLDLVPENAVAIIQGSDAPPVKLRISNEGDVALADSFVQKIKGITTLTYPDFTDYRNAQTAAANAVAAKSTADQALLTAQRALGTLRTAMRDAERAFVTATTAKLAAEQQVTMGTAQATDPRILEVIADYERKRTAKLAADEAFAAKESEITTTLAPAATEAARVESAARAEESRQAGLRVTVYNAHVSGQMQGIFPASIVDGNKLEQCRELGLQTSTTSKVYRWESYPLNSSCRALYEGFAPLSGLYADLVTPSSFIDEGEFLQRKKKFVQNLYLAAGLEAAQRFVQTSAAHKMVNHHCFAGSSTRSYIDKLLLSYPIKVNYDASTRKYLIDNTPAHLHPEPLFALRNGLSTYAKVMTVDAGNIYGTRLPGASNNPQADLNSVFCQVYGDACTPETMLDEWKSFGILVPVNGANRNDHLIDLNTFAPAVNINFKVRGLSREGRACEGIVFC